MRIFFFCFRFLRECSNLTQTKGILKNWLFSLPCSRSTLRPAAILVIKPYLFLVQFFCVFCPSRPNFSPPLTSHSPPSLPPLPPASHFLSPLLSGMNCYQTSGVACERRKVSFPTYLLITSRSASLQLAPTTFLIRPRNTEIKLQLLFNYVL